MTDFKYKEKDTKGLKTLDAFSDAERYNQWILEVIRPYCKGRIIEIGSGIGNMSQLFVRENFSVVLSDLRESYCQTLRDKFSAIEFPPAVVQLDLAHPEFSKVYAEHLNSFDSLIILNVLEHIKDDAQAIRNCHSLLKDDGHLIVFVPAIQSLYNRFDKGLGHFKRYDKKTLSQLISQNKFEIIFSKYMNFAGIFGWFFSGKVFGNAIVPGKQVKLFNHFVPLFRLVDRIIFNATGLGVVCVGKKK